MGRSAPQHDGPAYDRFYSVRWMVSDENQEAGPRLGRWYENDRHRTPQRSWAAGAMP
jgi:hypothetical protein